MLLNCQNARRRFPTMKMNVSEHAAQYINCAKQLTTELKALNVDVHDQKLAMTMLHGLPSKSEHFIGEIYAVADDEKLTLVSVKRRLLQVK